MSNTFWCSTGAIGLLTEQPYGLLFALLATRSLIFLGLMDITFNIQNNLYRLVATSGEMKIELLVNLWFLGFGIALIVCLSSRIALMRYHSSIFRPLYVTNVQIVQSVIERLGTRDRITQPY